MESNKGYVKIWIENKEFHKTRKNSLSPNIKMSCDFKKYFGEQLEIKKTKKRTKISFMGILINVPNNKIRRID